MDISIKISTNENRQFIQNDWSFWANVAEANPFCFHREFGAGRIRREHVVRHVSSCANKNRNAVVFASAVVAFAVLLSQAIGGW